MSVPFTHLEFVSDLCKSCFGEVRGRCLRAEHQRHCHRPHGGWNMIKYEDAASLGGSLYIEELILVIIFLKFLFTLENSIYFLFYAPTCQVQCCLPLGTAGTVGGREVREEKAILFLPLPPLLLWGVSARYVLQELSAVLQPPSPHPLSCAGGDFTLLSGTVHISLAFMVGRAKGNVIT